MDCDIVLVGLNHRTAAVDVRERFALVKYTDPGTWALPLGGAIHEALILSTCNRVELLAMGKGDVTGQMLRSWAGARGAKVEDLERYIYKYKNEEAVRHLFRVASSLDSMILGEPQILGLPCHGRDPEPPAPQGLLRGQARAHGNGRRLVRRLHQVRRRGAGQTHFRHHAGP